MKLNMSRADRIARIVIAAVIVVLYLSNNIAGTFAYILLALAGIFILTAIAGSCPLYSLFGIKTCNLKKSS